MVVEHAVRKLCEPGGSISLFVKLSAASMQDPDFLLWLQRLFDENGTLGKRLIIEIGDACLSDGIRMPRDLQQVPVVLAVVSRCSIMTSHAIWRPC